MWGPLLLMSKATSPFLGQSSLSAPLSTAPLLGHVRIQVVCGPASRLGPAGLEPGIVDSSSRASTWLPAGALAPPFPGLWGGVGPWAGALQVCSAELHLQLVLCRF